MVGTLTPAGQAERDDLRAELSSAREELARVREQLHEQEQRLQSTFELPSVGMAHVDLDGKWLAVSDTLCGIVGYSREELLGLTFQDITHPADLDEDLALVQKLLTGELTNYSIEKRYLHKSGEQIWIRLTAKLTRNSEGKPWFFVSVIENIHDRKLAEQERLAAKQALQASESRFRVAFDNIPDVVVIYDRELRIQYINPATLRTTGMSPEAFLGKRESEIFPADLIAPWQPALQAALHEGKVQSVEVDVPLDPGVRNLLITCVPLRDEMGIVKEVMGITHDFTDRKRAEEATVKAALHDKLTGLPNRALLFEYSSHVFDQAARNQHEGGMLFIDLDRFKPINDIHGHRVGDEVLKLVAQRIQRQVRKADLVFRLGGDEFLVLLPQLSNSTEAAQIAQRVLKSLAEPMLIEGIEVQISGSIGISIFPRDGMDMQSLVNAADNAMYHAKQSGKNNWQFYSAELSGRVHAQISLQDKVRRALKSREFKLVYQPIIDIGSGRVLGAEALLRWPQSGVGPDQFIPAAEAVGQIIPIGDWVMQEACRAHKRWLSHGLPAIPISVNVSALQMRQKDFRFKVLSVLRQQKLSADALQIELTESTLLEDMDYAIYLLNNLQKDGIKISLDDFGTGFSSLSYLSRLPINKIKIDKSFVRHLTTDTASRAVTEAIIMLGRRLTLDIIAEGIETAAMLDEVRHLGCHQAQGHYLSQPVDADAFEAWYSEQVRTPH